MTKEQKDQLRAKVGANVREMRTMRDLSIEELAKLLGITTGYLGLIERGDRGTAAHLLLKLSEVLDVSISELLNDPENIITHKISSSADIKIKNINSYVAGYSDEELDFIINVIKNFSETRGHFLDVDDSEE